LEPQTFLHVRKCTPPSLPDLPTRKKLGSIWNYMGLQLGDDELSVVQVISNSQAMAVLDDLGSNLNDLPVCGSFVKSC
jgi:hypothetical protein